MKRTDVVLADGRALIHYDGAAQADRCVTDTRPLDSRPPASTMRYDRLLDEWVAVASHRNDRTFLPDPDDCPLCPSRAGHLTEVPSADYQVVVFENRFPSFTGPERPSDGSAFFQETTAAGRCEVVCFTSDHDGHFANLTTDRARLVIEAWADRTAELSRLGAAQVFVFENRGEAIGVTMRHPHGQIYAYPFVTPRTRIQLDAVKRHLERTGRNLYDDVVAAEIESESRIVLRSEHWVAFVPFAARYPVEVHLFPRRRVPDFAALTDEVRDDLATTYLRLLRAADQFYEFPLPYIAAWHQAPVREDRDLGALHLELFSVQRSPDKLKYLAGSESAMGAFINDRTPESVAQRLREIAS